MSTINLTEERMCKCENVEIGSYSNQITLHFPWSGEPMGIDRCIAKEVAKLWNKGIKTTGCCCGHGKTEAYIGVVDEDIQKMKDMGYEVQYNFLAPDSEDSFKLRSGNHNW